MLHSINEYGEKMLNENSINDLPPLTQEEALEEALASARIEGFIFSEKEIDLLKKFSKGEINFETLVEQA